MWPLLVYEVALSKVEVLDRRFNPGEERERDPDGGGGGGEACQSNSHETAGKMDSLGKGAVARRCGAWKSISFYLSTFSLPAKQV